MTRGERTPAEACVECCCWIVPHPYHIYTVCIYNYIYIYIAKLSCCHYVKSVRHKADCGPGLGCERKPLLGKEIAWWTGLVDLARSGAAQPDPLLIFIPAWSPYFLYDGFSVLTKLPWLSADSYCYIVNWITDGGFCNCRILSWHSIFMNEFCSLCRLLWQGLPLGQLPYSFSTSLSAIALLVKTRNVWGRTRIANFGSSWACHKLGYQLISVISDLIKLWCWHLFTEGGLQLQRVYCLGHRLVAYHTTL